MYNNTDSFYEVGNQIALVMASTNQRTSDEILLGLDNFLYLKCNAYVLSLQAPTLDFAIG